MDKRFANVQTLVHSLARCNSGVLYPHVFLDYDSWQRLPYPWEEGLPTTRDTAALVNRIGALLTPEQVFRDMERVNAALTAAYPLPDAARYFGCAEYMRYDPSESEEGLLKLAARAFIRHGYNILPAIGQLEEDAGSQLAAFQRAFDAQAAISIGRYITAPVQAKLPILQELLDRICDMAVYLSDGELKAIPWTSFVGGIPAVRRPELVQYLKERRLYVNEPVEGEAEN